MVSKSPFLSSDVRVVLRPSHTATRMDESTDVPLGKKVNNDHKPFEGSIDEDPKVEESYDDANAQEVPVNKENVLLGDSMVTTTRDNN